MLLWEKHMEKIWMRALNKKLQNKKAFTGNLHNPARGGV
jgi:hypothetical protein